MAKKRRLNIILDTNWYVSASINRNSRRRLYELLTRENLTIFYSRELLEEYQAVISRKKFNKYIGIHQANRFINLVMTRLVPVEIKSPVHKSRDTKDNFLLSMSIDCAADYLVTGDPDLLELKKFEETIILTMAEFLEIITRNM
ncbi:MAG: putative toxin-antitoxin system toxin component, PIN family [Saprospiraceae bacterium]|nr:putative toxin-antitoxin system toxin component, PIN family [Saprospiraceae bacterium]